jgi:hypothetical protein
MEMIISGVLIMAIGIALFIRRRQLMDLIEGPVKKISAGPLGISERTSRRGLALYYYVNRVVGPFLLLALGLALVIAGFVRAFG